MSNRVAFVSPVMAHRHPDTQRIVDYRFAFIQSDLSVPMVFRYGSKLVARNERRNLTKTSNVYPVPNDRLFAAIVTLLQSGETEGSAE